MPSTYAVRREPRTFLLAGTLAAAGVIHCILTPEHLAMSAIFGAGFLAAGVAQFGMAGLAVVRPTRLLYAAVIASTVVLSSMYAYNVLVGLPFHEEASAASADDEHPASDAHGDSGHDEESAETDHPEEGLVLGGGEPVDAYGAVTQVAQFTAAAVALALLRRTRGGGLD